MSERFEAFRVTKKQKRVKTFADKIPCECLRKIYLSSFVQTLLDEFRMANFWLTFDDPAIFGEAKVVFHTLILDD